MLKNQAGDISLSKMSLIIYGREKTGLKPIDRDSFQGKKRYSKGCKTYLPEHVFSTPILYHSFEQKEHNL